MHSLLLKFIKKTRSPIKTQSGFTLIELVLVIVFLSVAIIASMRAMSSSLTQSMDVEVLMTATNLANEKLERIMADKKSKGYDFVAQNNYSQETNVNGMNGYNRYVTITVFSTYKEVKVKVTHSGVEDYELATFLTNY